jgi:hypothetical protein
MHDAGRIIPFSFDLSSLVSRSVASLYSHLVTRPTGRALRLGIESQIGDTGHLCLSVLDFTQVVVLDYSCADEAVAKLIQLYQQHREPIDEVLLRHGLALVAEVDAGFVLLGAASDLERKTWDAVQRRGMAQPGDVQGDLQDHDPADVVGALHELAARRVLFRQETPPAFLSLTTLLPATPA